MLSFPSDRGGNFLQNGLIQSKPPWGEYRRPPWLWPIRCRSYCSGRFLTSCCQVPGKLTEMLVVYVKGKRTKCTIGKPSCQVRDSDAYFAIASLSGKCGKCIFEDIFGRCTFGMHIWQVYDLKIYLASTIWDAYLANA